eukprot:4793781-Prymnesium_polylepis.1
MASVNTQLEMGGPVPYIDITSHARCRVHWTDFCNRAPLARLSLFFMQRADIAAKARKADVHHGHHREAGLAVSRTPARTPPPPCIMPPRGGLQLTEPAAWSLGPCDETTCACPC